MVRLVQSSHKMNFDGKLKKWLEQCSIGNNKVNGLPCSGKGEDEKSSPNYLGSHKTS